MENLEKIALSTVLILAPVCLLSCGAFRELQDVRELSVSLPRLPGYWDGVVGRGDIGFRIRVTSGDGVRELRVDGDAVESAFTVSREGTDVVIITAVPEIRYGKSIRTLCPAGAVYIPFSGVPEAFTLSWKDGFAAALLEELAGRSFPLERLNLERLLATIDGRTENPWFLDREKLMEDILAGTLTSRSVKTLKRVQVKCPFPEGVWAAENMLVGPAGTPDGVLTLSCEAPGLHRLFRLDSSPCIALLSVDGSGRVETAFDDDP